MSAFVSNLCKMLRKDCMRKQALTMNLLGLVLGLIYGNVLIEIGANIMLMRIFTFQIPLP